MMFARYVATSLSHEAGTTGLTLPRPTPPFFRLKTRSVPPLYVPFAAARTVL